MPLRLKLAGCTGCKLCQLACSAEHEKTFNPGKVRLKIVHECTDQGLRLASKLCIGCGDCVSACPKDVISLNRYRTSVIYDLCGGEPKGTITSKSPQTGTISDGSVGGHIGGELKGQGSFTTESMVKRWVGDDEAKKPSSP